MSLQNVMLMLADAMSESELIERLESAIKEHKVLNTEDSKKHIAFYCQMFLSKEICSMGGVKQAMEDVERLQKTSKLLDPEKQ